MKNFSSIIAVLAVAALVSGCAAGVSSGSGGVQLENSSAADDFTTSTMRIVWTNGSTSYVEPLNENRLLTIQTSKLPENAKTGDFVEINHSGVYLESYPGQFGKVYSVKPSEKPEGAADLEYYFIGKVVEIAENRVRVEITERKTSKFVEGSRFWVNANPEEYKIGDNVRVSVKNSEISIEHLIGQNIKQETE